MKRSAEHWSLENGHVLCGLCPHHCVIAENKCGICGVRCTEDGLLVTRNYREVSSIAIDPIEKKPLYHFYPGSGILSVGTFGCNMKCPYCQNWQISQRTDVSTQTMSPETLVRYALDKKSIGIAYTYSEPIVWFEFVRECAGAFRSAQLKNVMVTNGYIEEKPLDEILPLIDAWNIDLKTFSDNTYRSVHRGDLEEVKRTITIASKNSHVEVTTLIVTGINDTMDEMAALTEWLASVDERIPFHVSRYYPNYKYNQAQTDIQFMIDVYEMASKKLKYVYCGNITGYTKTHNTFCPSCGTLLVSRTGFSAKIEGILAGKCRSCGNSADFHL
jgi:pyruvate formate lyase activating enzyme